MTVGNNLNLYTFKGMVSTKVKMEKPMTSNKSNKKVMNFYQLIP